MNIRRGLLSQLSSFFPFPFFLYKIDLPADIHGHHALTKCVLRCEIHFSAVIRCRIHYWTLSHTTFHIDMTLFHWWDPGLSFSGFQARHVKLFIMCFLDILHSHWTCSYISHQNTDIIVAFHTQQKFLYKFAQPYCAQEWFYDIIQRPFMQKAASFFKEVGGYWIRKKISYLRSPFPFLPFSTCGQRYMNKKISCTFELRPYTTKPTASRPICAVKQLMAESVLWWGTTWEYSVL